MFCPYNPSRTCSREFAQVDVVTTTDHHRFARCLWGDVQWLVLIKKTLIQNLGFVLIGAKEHFLVFLGVPGELKRTFKSHCLRKITDMKHKLKSLDFFSLNLLVVFSPNSSDKFSCCCNGLARPVPGQGHMAT